MDGKEIDFARISFPDIPLRTRDGHKLRGFFGNLFREHSPLLHNHFDDGRLRYAYPLVQYKVIDGVAHLIGLQQGAKLLANLFLKINKLNIDGKTYNVFSKNIVLRKIFLNNAKNYEYKYEFLTPWMALNQKNFEKFTNSGYQEKINLLKKILIGNILTFYKGIGYYIDFQIYTKIKLSRKITKFKNKKMIAFTGYFVSNAPLPDFIGLGKSVARGFGTIRKISEEKMF